MAACKTTARWVATAKVGVTWLVEACATAVIVATIIGAVAAFLK